MNDTLTVVAAVNGIQYRRTIESRTLLSDFLRLDLGLTGTHVGCEHGVCGACTILLNGVSVRACLILAAQADGAVVETVESLGSTGDLGPLQQAFREHHALQCGFCTPGFLMTCVDLLRRCELRTDDEIRHALSGNVCRCTGYENIVRAVRSMVDARDAAQ